MKWIKNTYLQCIPLRFGVCLSFYCFFGFRNHCYFFHRTNWRLVTSICRGPGPVALHRTCYAIVCIVPWCPAVNKTSTASIQSIGFTVTGIPFFLVNFWFLSLVPCGFEMWGSLKHGIFGGLIFGPGIFLGFAGSPRDFFGSWLLAPFDHSRHLKSRVPPLRGDGQLNIFLDPWIA